MLIDTVISYHVTKAATIDYFCGGLKGKGKPTVLPYLLPSFGPEADPSVQAVSLQMT